MSAVRMLRVSCLQQTNFMEEPFRFFVEECDNLQVSASEYVYPHLMTMVLYQGLQLIHDTATFGSFTCSFLTQFRDEFSKLVTFSFPVLSGVAPKNIEVEDVSYIGRLAHRGH